MDTEHGTRESQGRRAFREKMEAQFKELSAKIEQLIVKVEKVEAEAKIEYHQRLNELREKREILRGRLDEFRGTSEEAWESLKSGVQKAGDDLKHALETALAKFK